jgi:hypothetical protein
MQLEAVGCLTLRYQENMQTWKQRQRPFNPLQPKNPKGERRSIRDAHVWKKRDVIKKQRGGFKHKKTKPSIFSFPT